MKRIPLLLQILVITLGLNSWAQAKSMTHAQAKKHKKPETTLTKKGTSSAKDGQLGTNFSFDSASVRGKYQMAGQGIAMVEDEKVLDLLGLRRSFKDRESQENSRR